MREEDYHSGKRKTANMILESVAPISTPQPPCEKRNDIADEVSELLPKLVDPKNDHELPMLPLEVWSTAWATVAVFAAPVYKGITNQSNRIQRYLEGTENGRNTYS